MRVMRFLLKSLLAPRARSYALNVKYLRRVDTRKIIRLLSTYMRAEDLFKNTEPSFEVATEYIVN